MDNERLIEKIEQLEREIIELKAGSQSRKEFLAKSISKVNVIIGVFLSALITSAILYAAQITFTDGTPISASQVNDNFTELYDRAWSLNGNDLYYSNGNVGIGTVEPDTKLDVYGDIFCSGNIRSLNRPWFTASGPNEWVIGSSGWNNVIYNTVTSGNNNNWYDPGTGRFTAPVSGIYLFNSEHFIYSLQSGVEYIQHVLSCNGDVAGTSCGMALSGAFSVFALNQGNFDSSTSIMRLVHLNAGDYVQIKVCIRKEGYYMHGSESHFSGVLLSAD